MQVQKRERRQRVLDRLTDQLKDSTKTQKKSTVKTPLTESDVKRIKKEVEILKK